MIRLWDHQLRQVQVRFLLITFSFLTHRIETDSEREQADSWRGQEGLERVTKKEKKERHHGQGKISVIVWWGSGGGRGYGEINGDGKKFHPHLDK